MKVHELLADLTNRHQDAQLLVIESNAADHILTIESIVREGNEKAVVLMGKSVRSPFEGFSGGILAEALAQGKSNRVFKIQVYESEPGKYQASVDGVTLKQPFDSEHEARMYLRGFVFGFTTGSGSAEANAITREP